MPFDPDPAPQAPQRQPVPARGPGRVDPNAFLDQALTATNIGTVAAFPPAVATYLKSQWRELSETNLATSGLSFKFPAADSNVRFGPTGEKTLADFKSPGILDINEQLLKDSLAGLYAAQPGAFGNARMLLDFFAKLTFPAVAHELQHGADDIEIGKRTAGRVTTIDSYKETELNAGITQVRAAFELFVKGNTTSETEFARLWDLTGSRFLGTSAYFSFMAALEGPQQLAKNLLSSYSSKDSLFDPAMKNNLPDFRAEREKLEGNIRQGARISEAMSLLTGRLAAARSREALFSDDANLGTVKSYLDGRSQEFNAFWQQSVVPEIRARADRWLKDTKENLADRHEAAAYQFTEFSVSINRLPRGDPTWSPEVIEWVDANKAALRNALTEWKRFTPVTPQEKRARELLDERWDLADQLLKQFER